MESVTLSYIPLTTDVTGFMLSLFPSVTLIAITRFFKVTERKNQVA